jgi:hypothetical protein
VPIALLPFATWSSNNLSMKRLTVHEGLNSRLLLVPSFERKTSKLPSKLSWRNKDSRNQRAAWLWMKYICQKSTERQPEIANTLLISWLSVTNNMISPRRNIHISCIGRMLLALCGGGGCGKLAVVPLDFSQAEPIDSFCRSRSSSSSSGVIRILEVATYS